MRLEIFPDLYTCCGWPALEFELCEIFCFE